MLKEGILDNLYAKRVNPIEFNFEALTVPSLYNFISEYEIGKIYDIVTSIKYSAQLTKKKDAIKAILAPRGFMPFASGTNRMCFRYLEDKKFIIKVPYKESGLDNGFREYQNQMRLKPFVAKTFDVHPSGCVSQSERVLPITNREEYMSVVDDVFAMLTALFGNYVLEDVGTKYFMNIGIRSGFGVVILDYPDMFELDGKKLFCNRPIYPNTKFPVCGGLIDIDAGFNCLVCKTCGKEYTAASLQKAKDQNLVIMEGDSYMKVSLLESGKVVAEFNDNVTDIIVKPKSKATKIKRPKTTNVSIFIRGEMEEPVVVEEYVDPEPDDTQKIQPEQQHVTIETKQEEAPKQDQTTSMYSEEQTNKWINELCVEMNLTQEELMVAEATVIKMKTSFSLYNKAQLESYFNNIREVLTARHAAEAKAAEETDQQVTVEETADEDEVTYEEVTEEEAEEEHSAEEQIQEENNSDEDDQDTVEEYEQCYSEDTGATIVIPQDVRDQIVSNEQTDSDSFVVGDNNQQDDKQETKKIDVKFPSTFLTGRDASQY